jgi:hypothetical protein
VPFSFPRVDVTPAPFIPTIPLGKLTVTLLPLTTGVPVPNVGAPDELRTKKEVARGGFPVLSMALEKLNVAVLALTLPLALCRTGPSALPGPTEEPPEIGSLPTVLNVPDGPESCTAPDVGGGPPASVTAPRVQRLAFDCVTCVESNVARNVVVLV